jgi:hypothetical protein
VSIRLFVCFKAIDEKINGHDQGAGSDMRWMPITIGGGDFTRQDSRAIKIIDGLSRDHPIHIRQMHRNRTKLTRNKSDQRRAIHHASRHDGPWRAMTTHQ